MKKHTLTGMLLLATCMLQGHADIIWPSDSDWVALRKGYDYYDDAEGDQNPSSIDLIGTRDTYSAGYWAFVTGGFSNDVMQDDAFLIRMRMGGESGNYVWQSHLDTDGDAENVEWIFQLVQSGSSDGVVLIQTQVGGATLSDVDIGSNQAAWTGDVAVFSRWTPVDGTTHHHVDLAVPWNTFTSITGVSDLNQAGRIAHGSDQQCPIGEHSGTGRRKPAHGGRWRHPCLSETIRPGVRSRGVASYPG